MRKHVSIHMRTGILYTRACINVHACLYFCKGAQSTAQEKEEQEEAKEEQGKQAQKQVVEKVVDSGMGIGMGIHMGRSILDALVVNT